MARYAADKFSLFRSKEAICQVFAIIFLATESKFKSAFGVPEAAQSGWHSFFYCFSVSQQNRRIYVF